MRVKNELGAAKEYDGKTYPLDEALGLSECKTQPDVQEIEAWLTSETPYETASETLKRCTGIELSNHHAHDVTNDIAQAFGVLDVCPSKAEIDRKIEQLLMSS